MANELNAAKVELTRLQQIYNAAKNTQAPAGNTSAAQVKAALNAFKAQKARVKQLEEATRTAANNEAVKAREEKQAADIKAGKLVVTPAMQKAGIDNDILQEFKNLGYSTAPENFMQGAVGSTVLVYLGTKKGVQTDIKGAKKLVMVTKDNVGVTNNVYKQFWDDPATKAKVKSAMVNAGNTNVNDLSAYEQWKQVVNISAELYAAGKGPKMTPMDVLNQVMSGAGGAANLPDRTITKVDPAITNAIANAAYQSVYMRDANEEEIKDILKKAGVDKMIAEGTVTTTKKVKNPKTGKLENVTTTTPGFNAQTAQLTIEDKLKEINPDELDRTKRIEWASWLSKNVAGA